MGSKKYECDECGRTFKSEEACEVHEEHCRGKKSKKRSGEVLAIVVVVIIIVAVWGLVGGEIARDVGITCDMGAGEYFCWTWHENVVGQIREGVEDFFERG